MTNSAYSVPGAWEWTSGVEQNRVTYVPNDSGTDGILTRTEEVSSFDDERGNGSHIESTQSLTEFLLNGPRAMPPVEIVEAMLTHFHVGNPAWLDPYRLEVAASQSNLEVVRELLAQGVQADTCMGGLSPLYSAISARQLEMAEMLFAAGVDVNRHFLGGGETILMILATYAPDTSWEPLAERILAQVTDIEAGNEWGRTALMAAARAGTRLPGLVSALLAAGANVNTSSKHGYTALMEAVFSRYAPVATVEQLLAAGADVNALDSRNWSALTYAISCTLVDSVRVLLAAGARVDAISKPSTQYDTPRSVLKIATDYANPEIIAMIQEAAGQ